MLSLLAPLMLALAPSAQAGELIIEAPARASVYVNGQPARTLDDGVKRASHWLAGGEHLVEVYGRQGQLRHRAWVDVPAEARVDLRADRYGLSQTGIAWFQPEPQRRGQGYARGHRDSRPDVVVVVDRGQQRAERPARPPAPRGPQVMPADRFSGLLGAIAAEPFGDDKITLLASASDDWMFTIDQVGALMDAMTFSSEKVEVARMLRPNIVDPENAWALNAHLTFSSDKQEVARMFA